MKKIKVNVGDIVHFSLKQKNPCSGVGKVVAKGRSGNKRVYKIETTTEGIFPTKTGMVFQDEIKRVD